jgi:hypothetical protein
MILLALLFPMSTFSKHFQAWGGILEKKIPMTTNNADLMNTLFIVES